MMRLAGVDGAKIRGELGWIVVLGSGAAPEEIAFVVHAADLVPLAELIAIDIPIGLPEVGRRLCDTQCRSLVEKRANSVFPVPIRSVMCQPTVALAFERAREIGGPLPTPVLMGIRPRILEVDEVVQRTAHPERWIEVHPELCFRLMADAGLGHSKNSPMGHAERRYLLEEAWLGFSFEKFLRGAGNLRVPHVDLADACAAYWTACRYVRGAASRVPESDERDGFGLPMVIWA